MFSAVKFLMTPNYFISFVTLPVQPPNDSSALFGSHFIIIFKYLLLNLQFRFQWKTAFVHQLFHRGEKNCNDYYHTVSLLHKFTLIFKKLQIEFIYQNVRRLVYPKKFGFQTRKIPITQLIDYIDTSYSKFKRNCLYIVYFDYQIAISENPSSSLTHKLGKFSFDYTRLFLT